MRRKTQNTQPIIGTLSVNIHGFGFVAIPGGSVFIPAQFIHGALSGDTVEVALDPQSDPERPSGSIKRILERRFSSIVGCVAISKKGEYYLRPMRRELPQTFRLVDRNGDMPKCAAGDWVKAELPIQQDYSEETAVFAVLGDIIGSYGNITADLDAIVSEFSLPEPYSDEETEKAARLRPTRVTRLDYTGKCTVTIDPTDARDFDDALSCERQRGSGYLVVGVHIADVACYIHNGSHFDVEARRRGFTSYLPGRTLPMIPKSLSNTLCCLQAGVKRLAHTVFLVMDEHTGEIKSYKRCHSTIQVTQRLCYDQVQNYFDGRPFEAEPGVLKLLDRLRDLSRLMRARRRREEQFLPMEMPEIRAVCSEHPPKLVGVRAEEDSPAHQLVEEFMLAANQCIAEEMLSLGLPALFRNHQAPDTEKLNDFVETAMVMTGMKVGNLSSRHNICNFLRKAAESPLKDVLYMSFLRHLPRADYGEQCLGHYGLGKERYCHFTSPIRRYPDTLVHQQLLAYDLRKATYDTEAVAQLGAQCSALEYNCSQAEFAAQDRLKIRLIDESRRQDRNFTLVGEVCRITKAGAQLYLPEYGLIAFINEDQLPSSRWSFDHHACIWRNLRGGKDLTIAMTLRLQVVDADPVRGDLDLRPSSTEADAATADDASGETAQEHASRKERRAYTRVDEQRESALGTDVPFWLSAHGRKRRGEAPRKPLQSKKHARPGRPGRRKS